MCKIASLVQIFLCKYGFRRLEHGRFTHRNHASANDCDFSPSAVLDVRLVRGHNIRNGRHLCNGNLRPFIQHIFIIHK